MWTTVKRCSLLVESLDPAVGYGKYKTLIRGDIQDNLDFLFVQLQIFNPHGSTIELRLLFTLTHIFIFLYEAGKNKELIYSRNLCY
jgi:hypothetical protein